MEESIKEDISQSIAVKEKLLHQTHIIEKMISEVISAYKKDRKILICGNGGSASDSQHFAAELVGRFKKERKALPAISLASNAAVLTAIGNDYGFEKVFSRQVEALGEEGDILISISTSGNSKNIIDAVKEAKKKNIKTIGLLGLGGGLLKDICDMSLIAPGKGTARVQEAHIIAIHLICDGVEQELFGENYPMKNE